MNNKVFMTVQEILMSERDTEIKGKRSTAVSCLQFQRTENKKMETAGSSQESPEEEFRCRWVRGSSQEIRAQLFSLYGLFSFICVGAHLRLDMGTVWLQQEISVSSQVQVRRESVAAQEKLPRFSLISHVSVHPQAGMTTSTGHVSYLSPVLCLTCSFGAGWGTSPNPIN